MSRWIDTRDLLDELNDLRERQDDPEQSDPLDEDEVERLENLTQLFDEIGEDGEAKYGATLIPVGEFADYAEQLAEELGVPENNEWPLRHIDWQAAADELAQDYTEVTFEGTDYLIRL